MAGKTQTPPPGLFGDVKRIPLKSAKADISPLIKTGRWAMLFIGFYYGRKRLLQIREFEKDYFVQRSAMQHYNHEHDKIIFDIHAFNSRADVVCEVEGLEKPTEYER